MFSTDNQPTPDQRIRKLCRAGHPLEQGNNNVRTRRDGKRVCRACESARNSERYQSNKSMRRPIPYPFSLDNISFDAERYEGTTIEVLARFVTQQETWLKNARADKPGARIKITGGSMPREFVIEHLEEQIPITQEVVLRKVREMPQEKTALPISTEPETFADMLNKAVKESAEEKAQ
jgi:hypothetical protein